MYYTTECSKLECDHFDAIVNKKCRGLEMSSIAVKLVYFFSYLNKHLQILFLNANLKNKKFDSHKLKFLVVCLTYCELKQYFLTLQEKLNTNEITRISWL